MSEIVKRTPDWWDRFTCWWQGHTWYSPSDEMKARGVTGYCVRCNVEIKDGAGSERSTERDAP